MSSAPTGTIGKEVVKALARQHQIVKVGRRSGDFQVDIADKASIEQLFPKLGSFDAVICTAGEARAGRLADLTDDDFMLGLTNKLMGQVNIVRIGRQYINVNGSFTLTSGVLSQEPMPGTAAISLVNAAVEAFARAAALDLDRGLRINAVSPVWSTRPSKPWAWTPRPKCPPPSSCRPIARASKATAPAKSWTSETSSPSR